MSRLTQLLKRALLAELAVFGLVGIVCLVGDVVFFNLLAFGLGLTPVLAKSISLVITGAMAFFGHRHFTFRQRRAHAVSREVSRFLVATGATVALSLLPLYLARHVAGITSIVGLNIANFVGIALGTAVRYLAYRYLVWTSPLPAAPAVPSRDDVLLSLGAPGRDAGSGRQLDVKYELVGE